jgi:hypothetical protein
VCGGWSSTFCIGTSTQAAAHAQARAKAFGLSLATAPADRATAAANWRVEVARIEERASVSG